MTVKPSIALFVALIIAGCTRPQAPSALAVTGATVIDVRDGLHIDDSAIVIESEHITAVGAARDIRIPSGARVKVRLAPLAADRRVVMQIPKLRSRESNSFPGEGF